MINPTVKLTNAALVPLPRKFANPPLTRDCTAVTNPATTAKE